MLLMTHQLLIQHLWWYRCLLLWRTLLLPPLLQLWHVSLKIVTLVVRAVPSASAIAAIPSSLTLLVIPTRAIVQRIRPQVGIEVGSIKARAIVIVVEAVPGPVALSSASALPATTRATTAAYAPSTATDCEASPPWHHHHHCQHRRLHR